MNQSPQPVGKDQYYDHDQTELLKLVTIPVSSVLELGCASGNMLRHYLDVGVKRVAGIEYVQEVAEIARLRCPTATIFAGDVDQIPDEELGKDYDLLIASFVLEHVTDPWKTLERLGALLRSGGQLVGSLPNVRHWSVTLPLILNGRWQYEDEGILDRTHYRFFSRSTIVELLTKTGFRDICITPQITAAKSKMANRLTLGRAVDHFAFAFSFSAIRA